MSQATGNARARVGRYLVTALGLLPAALLIACGRGMADRNASSPVIRIAVPQGQTGNDPREGIVAAARLLAWEGLTSTGLDGRPTPRLAQSWSSSDDGLTWTFTLRPGALFHDGSPVTPEIVRALILKLKDRYPGMREIVDVSVAGAHELRLNLQRPSSLLLEDLWAPILKTVQGVEVGAGPFVIESTSNAEVVLQPFERYDGRVPRLERITMTAYPTFRLAFASLMRGEVDAVYDVGNDAYEFVQAESSLQVYSFLRTYQYAVVFNAAHPPLRDPRVREALNYAVDRREVVEKALRGRGAEANIGVWPQHWAFDPQVPGFTYDPARALALLRTARGPQAGRLTFSCLIPEGFAIWERAALVVQRQLAEIDVDVSLEAAPYPEFAARVVSGRFETVLTELLQGPGLNAAYRFWHSPDGTSWNTWGYRSRATDAALDSLLHANGSDEYRRNVSKLQRALMDDPPAIPLAWGQSARAVSKRFEVPAEPGKDMLQTIGRWQPSDGNSRPTQ
jgi:peptide/nickel transport system substrate-binding protein